MLDSDQFEIIHEKFIAVPTNLFAMQFVNCLFSGLPYMMLCSSEPMMMHFWNMLSSLTKQHSTSPVRWTDTAGELVKWKSTWSPGTWMWCSQIECAVCQDILFFNWIIHFWGSPSSRSIIPERAERSCSHTDNMKMHLWQDGTPPCSANPVTTFLNQQVTFQWIRRWGVLTHGFLGHQIWYLYISFCGGM